MYEFYMCIQYSWHSSVCVHSYSLTQTELFLRSLMTEEPVKTVVAPEAPRSDHHRAASKEREKVFMKMGEGITNSGTGQMLTTNWYL